MITVLRSKVIINGEIINAIIDTRIVVVGGGIIKSKGRAEATIYFEKINIEIKTEVFDVNNEELIIGNDILIRLKAKIDFENEIMDIELNGEKESIPIKCEKQGKN
ncbi:unnamed protein product [Rhizophagus irregularis]|uniref:Uncharacterized protein n=1 Tax=Rhizophagus irregularis TaxID=588596 RepID=A0A2I1HJQ1_9GLOM|nr:hypothetical protein RhiirA4_481602 [Rhizophagus irregularis]CAB4436930.1 unnamed protein product [Rhizophagus irregularis]